MSNNVLDLFCGAGGMSLGFEMAGFKIVGGVDFDEYALKTHEKNFSDGINIHGDISKISDEEAKEVFPDSIDVIIGGPPCQGFSVANKWDTEEEKKHNNQLFYEFVRFVEIFKPKIFVIENVRGILTKDNGYALSEIERIVDKLGYNVKARVLDSSQYGVPQKRMRAFIVGTRKELNIDFDFDKIEKIEEVPNVYDAISDYYAVEHEEVKTEHKSKPKTSFQKMMRKNNSSKIYNHDVRYPMDKVVERIRYVPQGGNWRDVPPELWDTQRNNRHSSAYRRLNEKEPSITIDTGHMNYFHPIFDRVPTVRESARIQSFPDDFVFTGNKGAQFRQVGNAVPPLLAKQIAKSIKYILEERSNEN